MKLRIALLALLLCAPILSYGDVLQISGFVGLSATTDTFICSPGPCASGYGSTTVGGSNGAFSSLNGSAAQIHSLNNASQPLNQAFSLPSFLTLALGSNLALDLNFRPLGTFSPATCGGVPAPGQTCTPAFPILVTPSNPQGLSDLNFTNGVNTLTISFDANGNFREISSGNTTPFNGLFTIQIAGANANLQTITSVLSGGGTLSAAYSATFSGDSPFTTVPSVPEPASLLMLGSGLVGLAGYVRRKHA